MAKKETPKKAAEQITEEVAPNPVLEEAGITPITSKAKKTPPKRNKGDMTMLEAKTMSSKLSREKPDIKVWILVDMLTGWCSASFNPVVPNHEAVFCYKNGSEIAMDTALKPHQKVKLEKQMLGEQSKEEEPLTENKNLTKTKNKMETATKKKTAKKVEAKKAKLPLKKDINGGKTKKGKSVPANDREAAKLAKKSPAKKVAKKTAVKGAAPSIKGGKKKTLTLKEIIKLIKGGATVYSTAPSGSRLSVTALESRDPNKEREVLVVS